MAKDLPDLRQRGPGTQHVRGQGVPQPVRTQTRKAGPGAGPRDDLTHRHRRQRDPRGADPHEQRPTVAARAAIAQIVDQHLTNLHRQRQTLDPVALTPDQQVT